MLEVFSSAGQIKVTQRSKNKLDIPFPKSNTGQNGLSFLGHKIWNTINSDQNSANNVNSFKHKTKTREARVSVAV